ncbi:transposase [Citricoccus sp. K5]|uniref:transposase n=1 Tax=Citricoccus sp. K5 TaxID=2653135 RepID=UPI0012F166AB|nr:transposase [Citricoccus sp. K5]VXA97977.1 transposase [Citricoccus sp. K5]
MPKKFTPEFRDRAVRMVLDRQAAEGGPRAASIRIVAQSLGCGPETLRNWCRRAESADLDVVAVTGDASLEEENRQLRRELAETRRANEILKKASAFFAAELDRPTTR